MLFRSWIATSQRATIVLVVFDMPGLFLPSKFRFALLAGALAFVLAGVAMADATKSLSGKLRKVEGNVLTVEKRGFGSSIVVEIEYDDKTRVVGQLLPGMILKVKYREEKGEAGAVRRMATEVEAVPDRASKAARGAVQETKPKPE